MGRLSELPGAGLSIILITVFVMAAWGAGDKAEANPGITAVYEFVYGSGVESDPYQITNLDDLNGIRYQLDKHYILMNDLDFQSEDDYFDCGNMVLWATGEGWVPIGESSSNAFSGTFDGNGHVIKGLNINRNSEYQGLFGHTSNESQISNGRLEDVSVTGGQNTGALVGCNNGNISNFSVEGQVSGTFYIGGLAGQNSGHIIKTSMDGTVTGNGNSVGGLVGYTTGGGIEQSYSTVQVKGEGSVGGLVGSNEAGIISNSYAIGNIVLGKNTNAGGLVGLASKGQILNCYAVGNINWNEYKYVGGLIGFCTSNPEIENCYYDSTQSGLTDTGKGDPQITAEMKSAGTFVNWDIGGEAGIWSIVDTDIHYSYPYLTSNTQDPYPGYAVRSPKIVTSFVFDRLSPPVIGIIDQENMTIQVLVPYGTDVTNLAPAITYTGDTLSPASDDPQDFSVPLQYTVTAEDGSCQFYTVTVTVKEEDPVIVAVNGVDDITVACGTTAAEVLAALPETTTIIDSHGDIHTVFINWVLTSYDGSSPGDYQAKGTFSIPAGVQQADPPINLQVIATVQVESQPITPPVEMPPFWPKGSRLTAEYVSWNKAELNWTEAQDNKGVIGYRVYKDSSLIGEVSGTVQSYSVTGLKPSTSYLFQVQAGDADDSWTTDGPVLKVRTLAKSNSEAGNSGDADHSPSNAISDNLSALIIYNNENHYIQAEYDAENDEITVRLEQAWLDNIREKDPNDKNIDHVAVAIPSVWQARGYILQLPGQSLSDVTNQISITFITPLATLVIPSNMLPDELQYEAQKAALHIRKVEKDFGPTNNRAGSLAIEFGISLDEEPYKWFNANALVVITLPVRTDPVQLVDPEFFSVCCRDEYGELSLIAEVIFCTDRPCLTFECNQSGIYSAIYDHKQFADLSGYSWAKKPIEVLASKGILAGTSKDSFSPGDKIRRADYLMMLLSALGIDSDFERNFSDVDSDDYYYEALGTAKQLGIASGSDHGLFMPQDNISRQDMIVLSVRALKHNRHLQGPPAGMEILNSYQDNDLISQYAQESMAEMISEGMINGYNYMLKPQDHATRAEAAVFLYQIYKHYQISHHQSFK